MSNALMELRQRHEAAQLRAETARLTAEADAIENVYHLSDGTTGRLLDDVVESYGERVPVSEYPGGGGWQSGPGLAGSTWNQHPWGAQLGDRREGNNPIIYQSEVDLAKVRAIGRMLADQSPNAQCALEALTSYILGTGYAYKVGSAEGKNASEQLIGAVQAVVNDFLRENKWALRREEELFKRSRRDGEYFLALYHQGYGHVQSRIIEPEQVTEPYDSEMRSQDLGAALPDRPLAVDYGVWSDLMDCENVYGYHCQWRLADGSEPWKFFAADKMCHLKLNVDTNIKRGVSDFYSIYEHLVNAHKLLRGTAVGHAILANIAYIRKHAEGVAKSQVESMRSTGKWASYSQRTGSGGSRTRYTHYVEPGTIVDAGHGMDYEASPLAQQGVGQSTVTVENAVLQVVGTRWSMPPYMITGDLGNANYASSLVAESPFVKWCERQQRLYQHSFSEVLWKVLHIAYNAGRFDGMGVDWNTLQRELDIKVDVPIVHSRDRNVETARRSSLHTAGVLSRQTWAAEEGYDLEEEQKRGAEPQQVAGNPGDQPGIAQEDAPGAGRPQAGHQSGTERHVPVEQRPDASAAAVPASEDKPENLTTQSKDALNGAQITAAKDLMADVAAGRMVGAVAVELLVALGIGRDLAQKMIDDTLAGNVQASESQRLQRAASLLWTEYP